MGGEGQAARGGARGPDRGQLKVVLGAVIGALLFVQTWWFWGVVLLGLLALAAVAWIPRLGPVVLGKIGWRYVPLVGGSTGLAASGLLLLGTCGVTLAGASLAPSPPPRPSPAASAPAGTSESTGALSTTGRILPSPSAPTAAARTDPTTSPATSPSRQTATVLSVTDGDTIRVQLGAQALSVRYIGVDTPETVAPGRGIEPYGPEATDANRRLVQGRTVVLEKDVSETDSFGRLLRYVYVDGPSGLVMVNAELVRTGYARVATYPPDVRHQSLFLDLEREARAANRGLWSLGLASPATTPSVSPSASLAAAVGTAAPRPSAVATTTSPSISTATAVATPVSTPAPTLTPNSARTHTPTSPATSASSLTITTLFYDGLVPSTEADEYVEIRNDGPSAVNLSGWRLVSARAGQTYTFPAVTMQVGQTCRIYTNQIHSQWCGLSWRRGSAVWNNSGDRADLVAPDGTVASSVGYKGW